LERRF